MSTTEQWTKVVGKLVEKTKAGSLKWSLRSNAQRPRMVAQAYSAQVDDRIIAVYEYEYFDYSSGEYSGSTETASDVAIEFIAPDGASLWQFPEVPNRWELIEAVRYQIVNADEFLERFLK